jgi:RNA polymerase sigma factor (sigma-70 family)
MGLETGVVERAVMEDMELLRQYAESGSQDAFERLVTRHIDWVYSVCYRGVKDRHLAEDVTQAVFIILARKSKSMAPNTVLRGWLFKAARFAVADALKKQNRHKRHVQRAASLGMGDLSPQEAATWERVAPALEEAIACLNEKDRQAVMLRFYESKSLAEVGTILGISEEAAKKRVSRAVEKLRSLLSREGVAVSIALLLLFLTTRAAEAAPMGLGLSAASAATGSSTASGMATAIAGGASRGMVHAAGRLLAALAAAALLLLIGTMLMANLVQQKIQQRDVVQVVRAAPPRPIATIIDSTKLERFEHIWVGAKEKVLWQFHRTADGSNHDVPETVLDDVTLAKIYAVAIDREGITWVKKLNREVLAAPESADPQMFKPGQPLPITCTDDVLALLLTDDLRSAVAGETKLNQEPGLLTPAQRKRILQPADPDSGRRAADQLGDHEWHPLTPKLRDGALAEDLPPMRMEMFNLDGFFEPSFRDPGFVMVPEPAGLMTLLSASAALLIRRRKQK